jgi:hypothetical protein
LDGEFSFPEKLQSLKLYGNMVKLPEWIKGLQNLVKLKLRSSMISEHDDAIQVLGNLPNLASLHLLYRAFKGEEVNLIFYPETFESLVVLELRHVSNLQSVKFEAGATPKLELLQFYQGYFDSSSLSGLPSLSGLKEVVLINGDPCLGSEYLRAQLALNPNRPVLTMY